MGDALGAPVEFVRHARIIERCGPGEIGEAYGVRGQGAGRVRRYPSG